MGVKSTFLTLVGVEFYAEKGAKITLELVV